MLLILERRELFKFFPFCQRRRLICAINYRVRRDDEETKIKRIREFNNRKKMGAGVGSLSSSSPTSSTTHIPNEQASDDERWVRKESTIVLTRRRRCSEASRILHAWDDLQMDESSFSCCSSLLASIQTLSWQDLTSLFLTTKWCSSPFICCLLAFRELWLVVKHSTQRVWREWVKCVLRGGEQDAGIKSTHSKRWWCEKLFCIFNLRPWPSSWSSERAESNLNRIKHHHHHQLEISHCDGGVSRARRPIEID